jgi:hypothetical protein
MRTTPTSAAEVFVGHLPLGLVFQGEAKASAHRFWGLGSWSYLHPNCGHGRILGGLQQSNPRFNTRVDVLRTKYNFELKYRVVALTREDWTSGTGNPPQVKGHVCFIDESQMRGGDRGRGI